MRVKFIFQSQISNNFILWPQSVITVERGLCMGVHTRTIEVNRVFKANLQPIAIIEAGEKIRVRLCTKCLKRVRKDMSEGKKPFVKLAYVQTTPTKLQESKNQKPTSPNV